MLAYVNFGMFASDLSPLYLAAMGLLFLSSLSLGLKRPLLFQSLLSIALVVFLAVLSNNFAVVKFSASLALIVIVILTSASDVGYRIQAWCGGLWFVSGVITIVDPHIFSFLLYRVGSDVARGALGLTPEPSLYGLCSVFYMAYAISGLRRGRELFRLNQRFVSVLFFGLSALISQSMFAYMIAFLILLALGFRWLILILALVVIAVAPLVFPDSRLVVLLQMLVSFDWPGLLADASIAYRFAAFSSLTMGQTWDASAGQSAGIAALFTSFPFFAAVAASILLMFRAPLWHGLRVGLTSIPQFSILIVLLIVGPVAVVPYWLFITKRFRNLHV
jgi:hypothetical protein